MATRIIKYGNDFVKSLKKSDAEIISITYWDLWISIILTKHFNSSWDDLINHLYNNHSHYNEGNCESMVVHIQQLRDMLTKKDIEVFDIIADLDDDFLGKQEKKASSKIIKLKFQDREKSEWMHQTPRKIYYKEALQGSWDKFSFDPETQAEKFRKKFKKKNIYTKGQTFALEEKLSSYLEKNTNKAKLPKLFALYRAFLTVILENIDNIDDSYGEIGDLSTDIFRKYLELDWRQLSLDPDTYYTDIIRYVIWEDYGITDKVYPAIFDNLSESEIEIIELLLQSERKKLIEHNLTYQAENVLTMLGYFYAKNYLFAKFIPTAQEMGTREWQRILVLSEAAEKKKQYEIALGVFDVALNESATHAEYLRKEYNKLKTRITKSKNVNSADK